MIGFCSNDYLGLAQDPWLRKAAHAAIDAYGVGAAASPMISGYSIADARLEQELAAAIRLPRALYFYAGFAANTGILPALVGAGDAIFSDALNHASLIDGARLSRAKINVYTHADLRELDAQLAACDARRKLVISDAVFSMDGDMANIGGLASLCEQHDALLMLDDAHGFGVLGPQGRGALAAADLVGAKASKRVLYMATLGKALGVAGAFVAGPDRLIEWLLQKTRSYTYATAAPALFAETLRASLTCVLGGEGDRRRAVLARRVEQLRDGFASGAFAAKREAGWHLGTSVTAIQPLIIGDNREALRVTERLLERGFLVPAIRPPTVPEGTARLRIALSAAHNDEHVEGLLSALSTA